MSSVHTIAGFDLPHVSESDKIQRLLLGTLKSRGEALYAGCLIPDRLYWDVNFFGLNQVKLFQNASQEEQAAILQIANLGLLEEAYFIEKAGVGYMAKMVLLAETIEERMLYALFSGDEASHLAQISRFLPQQNLLLCYPKSMYEGTTETQRTQRKTQRRDTQFYRGKGVVTSDDAFLNLLGDLVEHPDKSVILFVLQVVLEGWGLSHYRHLGKSCQDAELARVLTSFLQDESRHHATGVTLFNQNSLSAASRGAIIEIMALFLQMIQVGPQRVIAAVEQVLGYLSRQQKIQVLEELETENHSGTRLYQLHSLMQKETTGIIAKELEERGYFKPFPAYQCV
jgi:hypothetical protein